MGGILPLLCINGENKFFKIKPNVRISDKKCHFIFRGHKNILYVTSGNDIFFSVFPVCCIYKIKEGR